MLHAIDVASQNKNAAIHILSTDPDVLILALACFPTLGANPCMLIGHGKSREFIVLKPLTVVKLTTEILNTDIYAYSETTYGVPTVGYGMTEN